MRSQLRESMSLWEFWPYVLMVLTALGVAYKVWG